MAAAHPATILVVDDDAPIVRLVQTYLEREGYRVRVAYDGHAAMRAIQAEPPDLIILDVMLPGLDGMDITRRVAASSGIPIILLTARTGEQDKLDGLYAGADDYVVKPFSPRELVARVKTVLRRVQEGQSRAALPPPLELGGIRLDPVSHEVTVDGRPVSCTPAEFRLLRVLLGSPGRAFTRAQLLDLAFGPDFEGFERNVDVHIKNLRRKLGPAAVVLRTVYGVGYKAQAPPKDHAPV